MAGPVPFARAWAWQQQLQGRLLDDPLGADAVLLLEHEPCYTLGRGASEAFLRFSPDNPPAPLFRIRLQATAELKQSLEHSNKAIENVTKASAEAVAKAEAKAAGLTAVRQPTFMSCFALQPPLNT